MVHRVWLMMFVCLSILLTGCVEVKLQVNSQGEITQTFTASVSQRAADVLKTAVQSYLGRNWRIKIEQRGEMSVIRSWFTYKSRPKAEPMPGLTVNFRRQNAWLRFKATYELQIRYNPNELFQTKDEQLLVSGQKLTVRIFMPGRIIPEQSTVASVEGDMAELTLDPLSKAEIKIVSVGTIWWLVIVFVVVVAFIVWAIAPYIPRIVEKFRRPSVKVVQR